MRDVRVLTVQQPWTYAILWGLKTVENRTTPWPSTVPAGTRIWLHSSARADGSAYAMERLVDGLKTAGAPLIYAFEPYTREARGAILGSVVYTGSHHANNLTLCRGCRDVTCTPETHAQLCSPWAEPDVWHWTLTDPIALDEPIPAKGRLGLWRPDAELTEQLAQAVDR